MIAPMTYRFSLISSVALVISLVKQTSCGSHEKTKENRNDFVPYTYIIEYTRTYDDALPSATENKEALPMAMPYPRLKSEDIHKKVAIFTEEGYDKGSYDHRGYDKEDKKWDDFMEYDHKSFGGSSENRSPPKTGHQIDSETGEGKISETFRASPSKKGFHKRQYQQLKHMPHPTKFIRDKTIINFPSPVFTPPTEFPKSSFHHETDSKVPILLSKRQKDARLPRTSQNIPINDKLISKNNLNTVWESKDDEMWSPFHFKLPHAIRSFINGNNLIKTVKTQERDHIQSSSSQIMNRITPLDTLANMHHIYPTDILDIKTNFDPKRPSEPFYTIETRAGIGKNTNNGLAPHDQTQANVISHLKEEESHFSVLARHSKRPPYTNLASGFPYKTLTRDLLPNRNKMRTQDTKSSLYSRKPCLSHHLKTAHFNLDEWKPKRGPPSWYGDDAPFLGPLKGQVDILRETVFVPVLKDALCE